MNKSAYRNLLARLPITNPTSEDLEQICPHLTKEQVARAFAKGEGFVALPPLRVRGAFQIVSLHHGWMNADGTAQPPQLEWSYTGRMGGSYADPALGSDRPTIYTGIYDAQHFAEKHWGNELIKDTWSDVLEIKLQDPSDRILTESGRRYPQNKGILGLTLGRSTNDIRHDATKPYTEELDANVVEMTTDPLVWSELKGCRASASQYNCTICASGLGLSKCPGCGHVYHDNGSRSDMRTPLSNRAVDLLRSQGHTFKVDPAAAWAVERAEWQTSLEQDRRLDTGLVPHLA